METVGSACAAASERKSTAALSSLLVFCSGIKNQHSDIYNKIRGGLQTHFLPYALSMATSEALLLTHSRLRDETLKRSIFTTTRVDTCLHGALKVLLEHFASGAIWEGYVNIVRQTPFGGSSHTPPK
jgi:hypothetical protein